MMICWRLLVSVFIVWYFKNNININFEERLSIR